MERFRFWQIGSLCILNNTYTTALITKQVARKMFFPPCLIEHIALSQIKMTYTKNARIKQVLKKNGYQGSIISKIFQRITNDCSLSQSQQQTQTTDIQEEKIKRCISLPYVEGTSEKLQRILRSHKIGPTFQNKNPLRKILCKPKDRLATEDKNNIVYEIDCSNFKAVYFSEPKRSLKSQFRIAIVIRMKLQNTVRKHKHLPCKLQLGSEESCSEGKQVNSQEDQRNHTTIHSLKNTNHINKIFYMLPET